MYTNKNLIKVRVWDLPTRIFHWLLAAGVIGLGISGTVGGNVMVWHIRIAYAVLALLLFRIVWGAVGGRWSRFGAFVYAPQSVINYLKGKGKPEHSVGHSPIGAASVFAMLGFPLTRFVSNATVSLATNYHANIGKWILLALVVMHIAAIVFYLWRKHNLVGAMLHGDKELALPAPSARDDAVSRLAALLIFLLCVAVAYWVSTLESAAF